MDDEGVAQRAARRHRVCRVALGQRQVGRRGDSGARLGAVVAAVGVELVRRDDGGVGDQPHHRRGDRERHRRPPAAGDTAQATDHRTATAATALAGHSRTEEHARRQSVGEHPPAGRRGAAVSDGERIDQRAACQRRVRPVHFTQRQVGHTEHRGRRRSGVVRQGGVRFVPHHTGRVDQLPCHRGSDDQRHSRHRAVAEAAQGTGHDAPRLAATALAGCGRAKEHAGRQNVLQHHPGGVQRAVVGDGERIVQAVPHLHRVRPVYLGHRQVHRVNDRGLSSCIVRLVPLVLGGHDSGRIGDNPRCRGSDDDSNHRRRPAGDRAEGTNDRPRAAATALAGGGRAKGDANGQGVGEHNAGRRQCAVVADGDGIGQRIAGRGGVGVVLLRDLEVGGRSHP